MLWALINQLSGCMSLLFLLLTQLSTTRSSLYRTREQQWRALSNGVPAQPSSAFSYISRSFRQTAPHIIGALRLLAESFTPQEINQKAWGLYADFRPAVDGWGQRSEVRCDTILGLRKPAPATSSVIPPLAAATGTLNEVVKYENEGDFQANEEKPISKKPKLTSLEEYEAELDTLDLDLSRIP